MTCPSQSCSTVNLSEAGGSLSGPAWASLQSVRSGASTLHRDPALQWWQSTKKGIPSSRLPKHKCGVHGSPLFPTDEHVFLWKDHTEDSGSLCCFQIWPCSLSQIIEPRPHSAGRNLGIASAGASEPPGQPIKSTDSWNSDSVGLGP